jgi:phenylacetic acid degradation operon negative regulatory protein
MVERGELQTHDGVYELAGRVQRRRGAQDWSLEPELSPWRGTWRVAVVTPAPRETGDRVRLRDAMRRIRFASPREGLWTRPDNLPRAAAPADSWKVVDAQCSWWSGRPDDDAGALAAALFEMETWSPRAEMLTARLADAAGALTRTGADALADGFVAGAAALAHIRADPLLPAELVADAAVGDGLRAAYRTYESAFSAALRSWFLDH